MDPGRATTMVRRRFGLAALLIADYGDLMIYALQLAK
jgi:hypothetical protein